MNATDCVRSVDMKRYIDFVAKQQTLKSVTAAASTNRPHLGAVPRPAEHDRRRAGAAGEPDGVVDVDPVVDEGPWRPTARPAAGDDGTSALFLAILAHSCAPFTFRVAD